MKVKIKLRPYQIDLFKRCVARLEKGKKVMMQLPTGGGKTAVFSQIANHYLSQGRSVLVIAHREELILQARSKLRKITGMQPGIVKAGHDLTLDAMVQIASIQTLAARNSLELKPELIIVDEAHHAPSRSYRNVLRRFDGAELLGVTATPWRADRKGFPDFDELVCGPTVRELIKDGWLCAYRLFGDPNPMPADVKRVGGDFSISQLAQRNNIKTLSGQIVSTWQEHSPGKKTLVFAINVDHSKAIAARYNAAGIKAVHLDATAKQCDRAQVLKDFENDKIQVLTSVGLFSEGLDIPSLEVVQVARPTQSLALWLQMAGRALRPCAGKVEALIIDHTDNWRRLGRPCVDRLWTLADIRNDPYGGTLAWLGGEYKGFEIIEVNQSLREIDFEQYMDEFEEANRKFASSQGYRQSPQIPEAYGQSGAQQHSGCDRS